MTAARPDEVIPPEVEADIRDLLGGWLRGAVDRFRDEGYQAGYAAGVAAPGSPCTLQLPDPDERPTQFLAADDRGAVRVTLTADGDWRFAAQIAGQQAVVLDVPSSDGAEGGITEEQMRATAVGALRQMPAFTRGQSR